ncbi:MAG: hypothetical protein ISS19_04380 [Bacteroidales bacterium]|nr:hypothetical protein [Bacteroidales bacterium]
MARNFIVEQLIKEFKGKLSFTRASLLAFFRQFDPDLKDSTFRWRLYQLKARKIITPISKDLFTLSYKPYFKPEAGYFEKKIVSRIEKQFPGLKFCIWSTKSVREFMLNIPGKSVTILQVEKDALEPVFEFLKDNNYSHVYIQPEEKEIERYIFESEQSIILQSLISKAPTQKIGMVTTITLEKMIVDLFCEKKLFIAFQSTELVFIINNAYDRYSINFTTLFHYARRRGKESDLKQFLAERTDIPKSIFND